MPKEMSEELAEIVLQLQEQLRFYREIGVTELGGALRSAKAAPAASFTAAAVAEASPQAGISQAQEPQEPEMERAAREEVMAKKNASTKSASADQAGLFAELGTGEQAAISVGPVLQPQDASLEAIREDIGECVRCKLHQHRTQIVFGEGNPQARLMFVGEGPGADEDATGRPFVGRAGQLLDKIIAAIGMKREDVYIANVVKCRPPGNRTPERDETATCEQFLFRQIAVIRPQVIVALGSPAFQCLLRSKETITRARGEWRELNGIKVMPTFHPAYLLRSPEKKREAWEDMKKVRDYLSSLPA